MKAGLAPAVAAEPALPEAAGPLYVVEGLASHAANLMTAGSFFYAADRFGWGAGRNLLMAAAMGTIFTCGALAANRVAARLGRRGTATLGMLCMALAAAAALVGRESPVMLALGVVLHMGSSSLVWPSLESLVCVGLSSGGIARRLAVYNVVWPAVGAATVPLIGPLVHHWPAGLFLLALLADAVAVGVLWFTRDGSRFASRPASDGPGHNNGLAFAEPRAEPELFRVRTQALWLSRIALPATFVIVNGLMAMMPSLPLIRRLPPETQTLAGGAWLAARFVGFVLCGWTAWWHTRPRAMLAAAGLMLVAFLGITLPWPFPRAIDIGTAGWLAWMIGWQVVLGFCMALIYSASLYFGMVLSDASAEHSGYHEALIGLGTVLGPGVGAAAQWAGGGGGDPVYGTVAVAAVLGASVVAAGAVSIRHARAGQIGADGSA